ncbi:hypothetical protein GGC63_000568 [Paenibacillus sp. OAS669]|nr:hypothetical protein [Paenibacillus sp. OAS669]
MEQVRMIILYLVFWPSVQLMGLVLFRIKPHLYLKCIIISTLVLTQTSYFLQSYKLIFLMSILHPIVLLLCFWVFYRLQIVQSLLMATLVFGLNVVLESSFNLLLAQYNYIEFIRISRNDYFIQGLVLTTINYLITVLLYFYRIGFTFVTSNIMIRKKAFPKKLILTVILGWLPILITSLTIEYFSEIIMLAITTTFFALVIILHLSHEKEMME